MGTRRCAGLLCACFAPCGTQLAVASTKSSSAVRRILHHRNPFRAEQRASSGTAMAVGAADKPSTTQPAPSGSDPPSERSFSWNAVDALVATSSDKHLRLVEKLQETEYLSSPNCVLAMQIVDRKDFVLPEIPQNVVYKDIPLLNSPTRVPVSNATASYYDGGRGLTISAPHMHAVALELLSKQLQAGARVLDVGSGSGYLTACFSYATQPGSYVLGVEKYEDVAVNSIHNLNRHNRKLLEHRAIDIRAGNIYDIVEQLSTTPDDLFNAIHVGAAAENIPEALENLLAPGGRLVIPVGPNHTPHEHPVSRPSHEQVLCVVDRDVQNYESGRPRLHRSEVGGVRFVPLTLPEDEENA